MTTNCKLRTSIVAVVGAALALSRSLSAGATTVDAMPELRNSPKIATPERVKADPFGGTASYAYRFDVPPGTAGLTPELVLTYNTQTRNTEYGYGWSLNIPYIERSTRKHGPFYGDPSVNDGEEFELEADLLVRDTNDPTRFYRRFADGSRIRYLGDDPNKYWEVTRPDGTQLLFGQTANARMHRNEDSKQETFRWALSEVRDLRGNSYRISYFGDVDHAGQSNEITYKTYIYPQRITYSHHPSALASQERRMVELRWGERANGTSGMSDTTNHICDGGEDCPTSYRAGFKVQQRYRLSDVVVGIDGNGDNTLDVSEQVRRYAISYGGARFSQIGSIRRYGKNDAAFPSATEFTYASSAAKFEDQASDGWALPPNAESQKGLIWDSPAVNGSTWFVTRMVIDMNGDGFPDRVRVDGTPGSHHWSVHLGSPTGFDVNAQTWTIDCGSGPAQMCVAAHTEYLQYYTAGAQKTDLVDMDGDGLPDRVRATEGSEPNGLAVYHNNGSGFDAAQIWTSPEWHSTYGFDGTRFTNATNPYKNYPTMMSLLADLNGDGRPDYISRVSHGYENTGAGFGKFLTLVNSNFAMGEGFNAHLDPSGTAQNQLIDVNGDGLPDFVKKRVCTAPEWVTFGLNLGTGGTDGFDWQRADGQGHAYRPTFLDATHCSQPPATYPGGSVSVNPEGDRPETHYTNTWLIDVSLIDLDGDGIRDLVRMRRTEPKADVFLGLGDGRFFSWESGGVEWDLSNLNYPRPQSYTASGQIFHTPVLGMASPGREYIRLLDMNGDGLLDYVVANPTGDPVYGDGSAAPWKVYLQKGPWGLLTNVKNELGGATTITYTPSTWLEHPIAAPEQEVGLPAERIILDGRPRWVVSKIEVWDGRTATEQEKETQVIDYAGFRMDHELREGSGVRLSESTDAAGLTTRSLMHQLPELRGKLERQAKCQGSVCFEQVDTTWTVVSEPVEGKSFLVRPTLTRVYACDESNTAACNPSEASSAVQVHEVEREFDETTGQLHQETDSGADGNVTATGDNLVRVIDYAINTDDWIVSLVSRERTYFGTATGTAVNDEQLFYDTAAASGNPEPSRCDGAVTPACGGLVRFRKVLRDAAAQDIDPNKWATESWSYDDFGNMATYRDAVAFATSGAPTQSVGYDSALHTFPVSIENAAGLETLLRFDAGLGEVTKVLSPGGYLRCFAFDEFGRLASRSEGTALPGEIDGDPAALCGVTVASFDYPFDIGNPETQRIVENLNPYNFWSTTPIEPFQNLRYLDGLGREYQTETAHKSSDGSFDVVARAWGSRGQQTCETTPFRRTGGIEGSLVVACAAQAPRRETAYDLMLRPEKTVRVDSGGTPITEAESSYLLDAYGVTSSAGVLMVERRKTFGGPGAPGQSPTPLRTQYFGLDNSGQVLGVRDTSSSMLTRIERDPKGRITRIDGPDVPLISGSDGNLLELSYDARDLRTRLSQPMTQGGPGPTWTFQYDANGKLFEWTSPRNMKIRTYRDAMGRVVLTDYGANSSPSSPGPDDWVYTYHPEGSTGAGQLDTVSGRNGITDSFDYDWKGRLLAKTRDFQGSMQFAFGYGYDALDRPTYTLLPDTTGIYYRYDGAQLTTVGAQMWLPQLPGFGPSDVIASEIDSHPSGGLQSMTLSFPLWASQAPITSAYGYGDDQRLRTAVVERQSSGAPAERIQDLLYSYDTAGNLRRSQDLLPAPQLSQDFGYDGQHRLVSVVGSGQYGYGLHTYAYDDAGNLRAKGPVTIDGQPLPGRMQLYYGRTAAQPTSVVRVDQQGSAGLVQNYGLYAYHEDGNATWRQVGNDQYLLERGIDGALEQVTFWGQGRDAFYLGDAQGLRAEKLVAGGAWWSQVEESRFLVDASYEVDTLNDRHEVHLFVGGRRVATSTRTGLGVYGPGTTQSVTSYHPDQVGTNVLVVKSTSTSQQVARNALEPFGQRVGGSATAPPRYLFTDQERDTETKLDDFGARTYDALIGRFLEQDPQLVGGGVSLEAIEGDGANLNSYAYVLNRPTGMIDPTGLVPTWAIGSGLSAVPGNGPGMGPTGRFADGSEVRGWSPPSMSGLQGYQLPGQWGWNAEGRVVVSVAWHTLSEEGSTGPPFFNLEDAVGGMIAGGIFFGPAGVLGGGLLGGVARGAGRAAIDGILPAVTSTSAKRLAAEAAERGLTLRWHAMQRLVGRESHVSLSAVERAITKGEKYFDPKNKSIVSILDRGMASGKSILIAQDPETEAIKTVITGTDLIPSRFLPLR